jgi:rare lipoprotein A
MGLSSHFTILMLSRFLLSLFLLAPTMPAHAMSRQCGTASHYGIGDSYHGQRTASGTRFNAHGSTAAHPSLPFGTRLLVTNRDNGKQTIVMINDRGPYYGGRILDLSYGSFSKLASPGQGTARICFSRI